MARLGASAVNCPVSAILTDVSKRSHRLAAMLQVAGCRGPGDSGAACMLEWGTRGVARVLDETFSAPEVLEPMRRQLGVAHRVLNVLVAEPSLKRPGVVAGVGQRVAAAVPQHVRVIAHGMPWVSWAQPART